ncbi:G1/S-specific cyclin CCN1 [Yarrowia sp. C11]|nr:G1/S-specific cyclin CCN1 [Yarrowia sp. E02]KAG5371736.1 G1/S-specific cyclin CCN1 [Yarrowia sp. C11]
MFMTPSQSTMQTLSEFADRHAFHSASDSVALYHSIPPPQRPAQATLKLRERALSADNEHEYADDMIAHMHMLEKAYSCDTDMMRQQPHVTFANRREALEDVVNSHRYFDLSSDTLFTAVALLDRYTSKCIIVDGYYPLVALAALWIAAKYVERKAAVPTLDQLHRLQPAYSKREYLQMEGYMLNVLEWSVSAPTADAFLDMFIGTTDPIFDDKFRTLRLFGLYLCECALFNEQLIDARQSSVAMAAQLLAMYYTHGIPDYPVSPRPDVNFIINQLETQAVPACIQTKYASTKFEFMRNAIGLRGGETPDPEEAMMTPPVTPERSKRYGFVGAQNQPQTQPQAIPQQPYDYGYNQGYYHS